MTNLSWRGHSPRIILAEHLGPLKRINVTETAIGAGLKGFVPEDEQLWYPGTIRAGDDLRRQMAEGQGIMCIKFYIFLEY